ARVSNGRTGGTLTRRSNGVPSQSFAAKVKASHPQQSLFDFDHPAQTSPATVSAPPENKLHTNGSPPVPVPPSNGTDPANTLHRPRDGLADSSARMASGEKAKARDIIAAIRTLKAIEQEQRPATSEEKQTLARFSGFGPVALSIFPSPVSGKYKDGSWQTVGEELKSLLTPEEYDSARRTTFNAFYTSPTVIGSMHDAIRRMGISDGTTVLEPGCGVGNFMGQGSPGQHFIGVELDSISGRIAQAIYPQHDIRIESFRD